MYLVENFCRLHGFRFVFREPHNEGWRVRERDAVVEFVKKRI